MDGDLHWENTTTTDWTCKYGPWSIFVEYRENDYDDMMGQKIEPYYRATARFKTENVVFTRVQVEISAPTLQEAKKDVIEKLVADCTILYAAALNIKESFDGK